LSIRGELPRHYPAFFKRAEALGRYDIAGPLVGDEARAIEVAVEGGQEARLYVRVGDALLRLTAVGPGNPMADIAVLLSRSMPSTDSRP
jgi:hypothetical protein